MSSAQCKMLSFHIHWVLHNVMKCRRFTFRATTASCTHTRTELSCSLQTVGAVSVGVTAVYATSGASVESWTECLSHLQTETLKPSCVQIESSKKAAAVDFVVSAGPALVGAKCKVNSKPKP